MTLLKTYESDPRRQDPEPATYVDVAQAMTDAGMGIIRTSTERSIKDPNTTYVFVGGVPDGILDSFERVVRDADGRANDPRFKTEQPNPETRRRQAISQALNSERARRNQGR